MNNNEIIQKINPVYADNDRVQIMIPRTGDSMTILNADEMIYHNKPGSSVYINSYMSENNISFPYSNIPIHKEKYNSTYNSTIINYINQLLKFNMPYIQLTDYGIYELFALKDKDDIFVIYKNINSIKRNEIMTQKELNDFLKLNNPQVFLYEDGIYKGMTNNELISDNLLIEKAKNAYKVFFDDFKDRKTDDKYYTYETFSKELSKKLIDKIEMDDIPKNMLVFEGKVYIRNNDGKDNKITTIEEVSVRYYSYDKYIVEIEEYPITIYTKEYARKLEKECLIKTYEPKFNLRLNKDLSRNMINKEKQKVLSFKKSIKGGYNE